MSTFKKISLLFEIPLDIIAEDLNYPQATICILRGDENIMKSDYADVYNRILSCPHHRDNRPPFEYAKDLAASWIMEDYTIKMLEQSGLTIQHAGEDKERNILSGTDVSTNSDCVISNGIFTRKLELMNDYNGYWTKYKKVDLRDNKYTKLKNENALFLGISTLDKRYIILNFGHELNAKYSEFHYAYHKPAYTILLNNDMLKDIDYTNIVESLLDEINCDYK